MLCFQNLALAIGRRGEGQGNSVRQENSAHLASSSRLERSGRDGRKQEVGPTGRKLRQNPLVGWGPGRREKLLLLPSLMIVRLVLGGRAGQRRTSQKSGKEEA